MHFIKIIGKVSDKNLVLSLQRGERHVKWYSRISEMCQSLLAKRSNWVSNISKVRDLKDAFKWQEEEL